MAKIKVWNVLTGKTKFIDIHPGIALCYDCGRAWDDTIPTSLTPVPSARCPFEAKRRLSRKQRLQQEHAFQIEHPR